MDQNQLKYKRLLNLSDNEIQYRNFIVTLHIENYKKRLIIRACCPEEIFDNTKYKVLSVKEE